MSPIARALLTQAVRRVTFNCLNICLMWVFTVLR